MTGKSINRQDKLRVLAEVVGMEPHELQFGGRHRVADARTPWPNALAAQDRLMVEAYLRLPAIQRKLVRELVAMLARPAESAD